MQNFAFQVSKKLMENRTFRTLAIIDLVEVKEHD